MSDPVRITIGTRTFTLLFPDLLRPLTEAERERLRASIQQQGVIVPAVVDEEDGVIDGGHRLTLASELGLETVPVDVRPGLTLDQKRGIALSLNADRRQLSDEELRATIVRRRQEGASQSKIAEEIGVSQPTVSRVLKSIHSDESMPETITTKDGREYPTTRRVPDPVPLPEPIPKPEVVQIKVTSPPPREPEVVQIQVRTRGSHADEEDQDEDQECEPELIRTVTETALGLYRDLAERDLMDEFQELDEEYRAVITEAFSEMAQGFKTLEREAKIAGSSLDGSAVASVLQDFGAEMMTLIDEVAKLDMGSPRTKGTIDTVHETVEQMSKAIDKLVRKTNFADIPEKIYNRARMFSKTFRKKAGLLSFTSTQKEFEKKITLLRNLVNRLLSGKAI